MAAGDEEAFREFHAHYFDRLYRFLLVVARGQEHEAQEALKFAAALVSLKMEAPGPFTGTLEDVERRIRERHS